MIHIVLTHFVEGSGRLLVPVATLAGVIAAPRAAAASAEMAPGSAASATALAASVPDTTTSAAAAAVIRWPTAPEVAVSVSGVAPSRFPIRTVAGCTAGAAAGPSVATFGVAAAASTAAAAAATAGEPVALAVFVA